MTAPHVDEPAVPVIADHLLEDVDRSRFSGYVGYCRCRFSVSAPTHEAVRKAHAAHVVAAIRDSGLTVIALPEGGVASDDSSVWHVGSHTLNLYDGGDLVIDDRFGIDVSDLPDFGAALIAAAKHAGDTQ